ncbi:acyltransferase family protein [Curtobacterium sp. RRHDQ66]|uniref:acyltransferase family protein n=1 Tax=Curtobacterium guangdongense TaxID=3413380 RepID=UPI003BF07157
MVELDGLRTVLAVAIVAYHVGVPGLHAGVLALPAFFAMSGFLITNGLLAEHRREGRIALARFARSRLLRIGPPLAVLVGGVALLWPLVGGYSDSNPNLAAAAAIALTSTTNLARLAGLRQGVLDPIWSLAAEEQFYLLWPLAFIALFRLARGPRILAVVLAAAVVLGPIVSVPLFAPSADDGPPTVYYAPSLSMSALCAGCLGALVINSARRRGQWNPAAQRCTMWAGAASLGVIVALFPAGWKSDPASILVLMPTAAIASTALIAGLEHPGTALAPALRWRPLVWYGANATYSLYLWHVVVLATMLHLGSGAAIRGAALVISIGVGALLGVVVEQPMARLRRRLDSRPTIRRGHAR